MLIGGVANGGGGGDVAGGGRGAAGTRAMRTRGPQSRQSVPSSQLLNTESGPPSSQKESDANFGAMGQPLVQSSMRMGGGGGDGGGGDGGDGGGGSGFSLYEYVYVSLGCVGVVAMPTGAPPGIVVLRSRRALDATRL